MFCDVWISVHLFVLCACIWIVSIRIYLNKSVCACISEHVCFRICLSSLSSIMWNTGCKSLYMLMMLAYPYKYSFCSKLDLPHQLENLWGLVWPTLAGLLVSSYHALLYNRAHASYMLRTLDLDLTADLFSVSSNRLPTEDLLQQLKFWSVCCQCGKNLKSRVAAGRA